ncbi:unnamed protein product [Didymodactylos carnosus]|uniref:Uncharacterized protein n=1 Tax=Didymodactylos carnosus TaxID=1234261 RepID=A0A815DQI3_9BILA|nr:unnamed protein product [Didymodactylos carnosus]CAF1296811.1 unnamed protein product [Didymodactylos carnosus]CAF3954400.1 unnamed protein product [Didymodactylos carnosus]CAF4112750.1 unnamed protein product [Didymodactylos carnosus]
MGMFMYTNAQTDDIDVSEYSGLRIILWKQRNSWDYIVVASNSGSGNNQNQFNKPGGVYVDEQTLTVYIVDTSNHRIQKWLKNSTAGITMAGAKNDSSGTQNKSA